ncbi:hypothetical protein [Sedimentibacter sp.]|uniref:hypothetical protein n=1 Tax=Sedimentibacter sp. TaxID=1960295 RepID=UPI00289CED55|nr:hypothetical protein [Sedimentibacter sp.]
MAFLNNLGKKISDAAGTATEKAKDFAETTKLNSAISSEEKQINQYFIEIGKMIFEQDKGNPDSPMADLIGKIVNSYETIDVLKRKIEEIKLDNN